SLDSPSVMPPAEALLGWQVFDRLADAALDAAADAAAVEVLLQRDWGGLTRFANSQIHQNVWAEDLTARVRVVTDDGRVGVAGTHTFDPADVAAAAGDALALARVSPQDPEFPGLAGAAEAMGVPVDDATLWLTPADRAAAVAALLAEVPPDYDAAGAYSTGGSERAVVTSEGQRAYAPLSSAQLTVVVMGPSSSGYAEAGGRSVEDVDAVAAARTAVTKARAAADPVEVAPGPSPVVLEPAATAALVQFLAYLGFGGRDWLEGRAFTSQRLGDKVVDPKVTVVDDARAPQTVGFPFDCEGTPKQRVELIREGVATAVVHDRHTAARARTESTGHGLPAPNPHGPMATNPIMLPGEDGSVEDLVAGTERGLLITRLHYTNVVHPLETSITGMTRDGTFLIADGAVTRAVRNLRFTQSILEALAEVEAVSSQTAFASELFFGGSRCPGVRLPALHFTATTTFG
ncbi:MAG: TldD/PmbA family protein, partial [Actinomycetota bacterium]|nr:TldD/PmbA family protein [Actinomycetota bacterium]